VPFEYTRKEIEWLEECLSAVRLRPYYVQAGGDASVAFQLYVKQVQLSAALWAIIHAVEVALRNKVHKRLSEAFGCDEWWDVARLYGAEMQDIFEVKQSLAEKKHLITANRVVSELSLGFWTKVFHSKYERILWIPHLKRHFPGYVSRLYLFNFLSKVKDLRNRIAHHDSLLKRDLTQDYDLLLSLSGVLSITFRRWVEANFAVPSLLATVAPKPPASTPDSNEAGR
jgi:hypothetical protein